MIELPILLTASVVAACLVLLLAIGAVLHRGARDAGLGRGSALLIAATAGLAQAGWLVATAALAWTGLYSAEPTDPFPWIGLGLIVPLVAGVLALRLPAVAVGLGDPHIPALLAAVQVFRIEGGIFLVLLAMDRLPAGFAVPAGVGDVLVGVLAPFVAFALWRRPQRRVLGIAFNTLGLLDLVIAVGVGVLLAPGPLQTIVTEPTTEIMALLPMALIPTFAVPLAIVLHLASFRLLIRPQSSPPPPASAVSTPSESPMSGDDVGLGQGSLR